ncbi:ribonuclease H-like domain-containing protein, partial [Roridomyces roridus]
LPVYSYSKLSSPPKMRFARTEADTDKWIQELDLAGPIAMDCEWVFVRRKGGIRPVSVIQLADKTNILVIQLRNSRSNMARFPIHLQRLLENPEIPKMGANILNDAKKLFKDYGIMAKNVVELGGLAKQADPASIAPDVFRGRKTVALAKLVERYLRKKLSKDEENRMGDWEAENLSAEMLEYAANDPYSALQVYHHLLALAETNAITLDPTKYTDRVHYERLHSAEPGGVLPVPTIVFTPMMSDAKMQPQQLRAYRYFLAKRYLDMDTMCKELCLK